LGKGADVDLIEEFLRIVSSQLQQAAGNEEDGRQSTIAWLNMIPTLERFSLMLKFADRSLVERLYGFLDSAGESVLKEQYNISAASRKGLETS
jgi:hypothetical protein